MNPPIVEESSEPAFAAITPFVRVKVSEGAVCTLLMTDELKAEFS